MKRSILVVAPYMPWPADFGGAARVYHLLRGLARDHDVLLCAPVAGDSSAALNYLGEFCDVSAVPAAWTPRDRPGWRKRMLQARALAGGRSFLEESSGNLRMQAVIDRLFLTRRIDLVQFEYTQTGLFATPRPCPTVIDVVDIDHTLLRRVALTSPSDARRIFNTLEAGRARSLERRVWRQATACVTTSETDASLVAEATGTPAVVVPNGVDVEPLLATDRHLDRPVILFVGTLRHAPNADGVRWFLERVFPRVRERVPNVELAIVGSDPPPDVQRRQSTCVTVAGRVDDVRPWLSRATIEVVPLLSGGGTRIKIVEALAAGVPVVSTTIGAEGLDLRPESDILLADRTDDFADAVVRVLTDPGLARRLSDGGRDIARERFDWSRSVTRLVAAHDLAIERFASEQTRTTT